MAKGGTEVCVKKKYPNSTSRSIAQNTHPDKYQGAITRGHTVFPPNLSSYCTAQLGIKVEGKQTLSQEKMCVKKKKGRTFEEERELRDFQSARQMFSFCNRALSTHWKKLVVRILSPGCQLGVQTHFTEAKLNFHPV